MTDNVNPLVASMASLHAPAAAAMVMADKVRTNIATALRKRADWLRSEYLNGGDFEHLHVREQECRYIAAQIEASKV